MFASRSPGSYKMMPVPPEVRTRDGLAFVFAVLSLLLVTSPQGQSAWAGSADSGRPGPALEMRLVLGSDQCPKAVQVWLTATSDTIQGFEIVVGWDRPDFAMFAMQSPADSAAVGKRAMAGKSDSLNLSTSKASRPKLNRVGGLTEKWEYLEARGESGLWAKVTGFAYMISNTRPRPIVPGDSGVLFSIPLVVSKSTPRAIDGDSAVVGLDPMLTRLSDTKGNLLKKLVLRQAIVHVAPCFPPGPKH